MSTIEERAAQREAALLAKISTQRRLAKPSDYVFDKAQEAFWDTQDNSLHLKEAVDASIPQEYWRVEIIDPPAPPADGTKKPGRPPTQKTKLIPPSRDIMRVENDQFVEGSTWWPGMPKIIQDVYFGPDGMKAAPGRRAYNQYLPPPDLLGGNAAGAQLWVDHVKRLWPDPVEHDFFFDYLAHMVQHPEEKANGCIVLSGDQGIGKDSALHLFKRVVGDWNVKNITPDDIFSQFRPWLQTLMLVVDEIRPSNDDFHASSLYNILKPWTAAPPDSLPINDKHVKMRHIVNVLRLFITTNNWMDMYIPPNDRRMHIMHSKIQQGWHIQAGDPDYFTNFYAWASDGVVDVAAWLRERDLSNFAAKDGPPKTAGWKAVTSSWSEPEDGIAFAIEALGKPPVIFNRELINPQFDMYDEVKNISKSPRKLMHRMQRAGYELHPNPDTDKDWDYSEGGKRFRAKWAFVRSDAALSPAAIARALTERGAQCVKAMAVVPLRVVAGGGSPGGGE